MGLRCPSCGEDNREGAPFCTMCKAVLNRARVSSGGPPPIRLRDVQQDTRAEPVDDRTSPAAPEATGPCLVFLDPPHGSAVNLDAVAASLGLQIADARMRAGLAIPAPVAIAADAASALRLASSLRAAGLRVSLPSATDLLLQPAEEDVSAFAIDDVSFSFRTSEGEGSFAWPSLAAAFLVTQSSFAVRRNRVEQEALREAHSQIQAGYRALAIGNQYGARDASRRALALLDRAEGGLTERTTVTLHLVAQLDEGERVHLVLTQGSLRYEGLGAHRGSGGQESWDALLARVVALAPHVPLDRRAERAEPRFPALPGLAPLFGGKLPSPGWLHGAYLAWRSTAKR